MEPLVLVLASDGVWLYTSNNEVKDIVNDFSKTKDANNCAIKIVEKASENGMFFQRKQEMI